MCLGGVGVSYKRVFSFHFLFPREDHDGFSCLSLNNFGFFCSRDILLLLLFIINHRHTQLQEIESERC